MKSHIIAKHDARLLMGTAKEMSYFMEMRSNANVGSFPITSCLVAIVSHVIRVGPCTVRKGWHNLLQA